MEILAADVCIRKEEKRRDKQTLPHHLVAVALLLKEKEP